MKCPNDETVLQMTTRENIEIDYCPQCRGVWLDRGELDKIIERSSPASTAHPVYHDEPKQTPRQEYPQRDDYRHDDRQYKKRKKESFLGDLFDF